MNEQGTNHATSNRPETAQRSEPTSLSDRVRSLRLPEPSAADTPPRAWLPWTLCLVLAVAATALGFHDLTRPPAEPVQPSASADRATGGRASVSAPGQVVLESKGYIVAVQQIQVSPKISGEITALHFKEGDYVAARKVLAEIEDVNYRADRDRAQAALEEASNNLEVLTAYRDKEVEQAKARWEETEAQRVQLDMDRRRSQTLRRESAMAARDYEQSDSSFRAMDRRSRSLQLDFELLRKGPRDINIKAAEARIREARADLAKYEWQLANCKIRAPVAGIILTKKAEVHNIVNPIAFNISATICEMADLSNLEVDLSIQERDVAKLAVGQPCVVRPEAFAQIHYDGTVSRLMPVADRAKGAVSVRVKVDIPKGLEGKHLLPERSALVEFRTARSP